MTSPGLARRLDALERVAGLAPEVVVFRYLRVNAPEGWAPTDSDLAAALEADRQRRPESMNVRDVFIFSPFCDQV